LFSELLEEVSALSRIPTTEIQNRYIIYYIGKDRFKIAISSQASYTALLQTYTDPEVTVYVDLAPYTNLPNPIVHRQIAGYPIKDYVQPLVDKMGPFDC
jgi:hypothetical protein